MNSWLVRADTGGTFTDGWARSPEGEERRCKVLSSGCIRGQAREEISEGLFRVSGIEGFPDGFLVGWSVNGSLVGEHAQSCLRLVAGLPAVGEILEFTTGEEAPVLAARILTRTRLEDEFPTMDFRVATTRGTNALLEGKGTEPVLFITQGFRDLPEIRDQRRPELFARVIEKLPAITRKIVEVSGRQAVDGRELVRLDEEGLRAGARNWVAQGEKVAVVALLHSDRFPAIESRVKEILLEEGFQEVTTSTQLGARLGFLPRMETALANGYLGPVMNEFKRRVASAGEVSFLTSAGGLQVREGYEPVDSLLSGPAGGLVGALEVARGAGFEKILTFDMGGTSTDVARLEGAIPLRYEQAIGPVRVRRPGVKMETVAAGGGSICRWHQGGLEVGPHSAGADPGPACYGRGGPLTVTDVNFLLGFLDETQVEIPLSREDAWQRFVELKETMRRDGAEVPEDEELLAGLRAIAVERMAEAVRSISVGEGFEPAEYTLVAFGGAGPQHACELADSLGVKRVLVPGDAGLLSAWGLHRSRREGVEERQVLQPLEKLTPSWASLLQELKEQALSQVPGSEMERWLIEVRVAGQASTIELEFEGKLFPSLAQLAERFSERYWQLFGYARSQEHPLEVVMVRAVASEVRPDVVRESFANPEAVSGLLNSSYCTILVGEGWQVRRGKRGSLLLEKTQSGRIRQQSGAVGEELMRARFESIAESMGELLRRTALSTNVKERLDFSCALLDGEGRLLVNAPHIPVHLGALGVCVRKVSQDRVWKKGDVVVVNHPAYGGSHLPDVTVVSPIFGASEKVVAFVANRAHHSEIGGRTPGSMPGDARNLEEEGVVIAPRLLFDGGEEGFDEVEYLLRNAPYPSRAVAENLADLRAQAAANFAGEKAMAGLFAEFGEETVSAGMESLRLRAAQLMSIRLQEEGSWSAEDALDDGTPVQVRLTAREGHLHIDFAGTGSRHAGNLNATEGVIRSAVLYVLRLWLNEDLPLNEGLMEHVTVAAEGTFLQPDFPEDVASCPAVVGGNVETSQRIVEVLLRALGVGAESQGTMNNFLFGNERFGYYETIGGGSGATDCSDGASGVHVHMTNTAITDPEVFEYRFPVRLHQFSLRKESGGEGRFRGGNGLVREVEFLEDMTVTLLTQRREEAPRGLANGGDGLGGKQELFRAGSWQILPGIVSLEVAASERIRVQTPGGGGWG
ncbi:hydantoinase B/oxoprolinase family protein [Roseibacillus persicicus]|uniref:hydantoinase B/oxoprolinase family protein n=1 Tax=Roseibacillus persicicus TaxID=454148 RepID=UPI001676EC77|nr:hydantoinase B/oxoprolinase family protein [Roseibacillus persicicus]